MPDVSQLSDLDRRRNEVRQFLSRGDPSKRFITQKLGGDSYIEKAFAIYYLGPTFLSGLAPQACERAIQEIAQKLEYQRSEIRADAIQAMGGKPKESAGLKELPNSYTSALLAAAYLKVVNIQEESAQRDAKVEPEPPESVAVAIDTAVSWLRGRIVKPDGYVPSLYASTNPSSYLTFWCAAVLCEWRQYRERHRIVASEENQESLERLRAWSGRRLRDMLAFHHGKLRPQFDVIETVYACATLLMTSEASDDKILVEHALSVLFDSYFQFGCLEASAPVFTDVDNLSVQISTAEALATIFLADPSGKSLDPHLHRLKDTYEWLKDHGGPENGWHPEGQGRANRPNAYSTAAATLLLNNYGKLLDDQLDREVRSGLQVGPFVKNPKFQGTKYPGDLGQLFQETIFGPIKSGQRKIASYSMVLYGPPGTSKTTVAKLISRDLEWPLLQMDAGKFMQKGRAGIDETAAEVFAKLSYLKSVVVLFDEVEELVGERGSPQANMESRLLTTAMLPRLQELRDKREIVFILATNHVESIDSAIIRLGRFDIVRCVLPPTAEERKTMLNGLVADYNLPADVRKLVDDLRIAEKSNRFCYGDLDAFVRELAIAQTANKCNRDAIERVLEHAQARVIPEDKLEKFEKNMKTVDRPGLRTAGKA